MMMNAASNKVKVWQTGFGFIIGREVKSNSDEVVITHPGLVQIVPTKEGIAIVINEFFPPFLRNKKSLWEYFPVKTNHILYDDAIIGEFEDRYEIYERNQIEKMTGIQIVGSSALNALKPKHPGDGLKNEFKKFLGKN